MKNLVLIVGVPRSGTTWLWSLLDSHPETVGITIEHIHPDISSRNIKGNLVRCETGCFVTDSIEFAEHRLTQVSMRNPGKFLVEKSPTHMIVMGKILKAMPEVMVLHIVRDPRAVINSMLATEFYSSVNVDDSIKQYEDHMKPFLPFVDHKNVYTLKYEELLYDPNFIIENLCEIIGLDPGHTNKMITENFGKSKIQKPGIFRRGEACSYKKELKPEQIKYIENRLGFYIDKWEYR